MPKIKGQDSLRFLMEEHGLRQSDLPEVGSQGVISEIFGWKAGAERPADTCFVETLWRLTLGIRIEQGAGAGSRRSSGLRCAVYGSLPF